MFHLPSPKASPSIGPVAPLCHTSQPKAMDRPRGNQRGIFAPAMASGVRFSTALKATVMANLLAGFIVSLMGVACVSERNLNPETPGLARAASHVQNWDRAQDLWSEVLNHHDGQDPEARLALAEALYQGGSSLSAIQVLRGGLPIEGQELAYGMLLGKSHLEQGQIRAAGQVFTGILAVDPGHAEALELYGLSILDGGRGAKGIDLLLRTLRDRLSPELVSELDSTTRQDSLVYDGQLAERVAMRARQLELFEQEAEAWRLRLQAPDPPAEAYFGAAQSSDAAAFPVQEWLDRTLELDPQFAPAWFQLGERFQEQGAEFEALSAWKKAAQADPSQTEPCWKVAQWYVDQADCVSARIWIHHGLAYLEGLPSGTPEEQAMLASFEKLRALCDD